MDDERQPIFSREEIPSQWFEHGESVSRMSEPELHEVARKAIHLFFRLVTQSDGESFHERFRLDLDTAEPEVKYLFRRMTAGDRLSSPLNWEESDEGYRQRGRGIAAMVAERFTGYKITPEDWPIP